MDKKDCKCLCIDTPNVIKQMTKRRSSGIVLLDDCPIHIRVNREDWEYLNNYVKTAEDEKEEYRRMESR